MFLSDFAADELGSQYAAAQRELLDIKGQSARLNIGTARGSFTLKTWQK
jgi:hypothetical protein